MPGDPFVTAMELALELRRPLGTLYVWRSRGKGPVGIKLGRALVYRRSEITRWLRSIGDTTQPGGD